jgi:hypothetical protein
MVPRGSKERSKGNHKENHRGRWMDGEGENAEVAEGSKDNPSEARKEKKGGRR